MKRARSDQAKDQRKALLLEAALTEFYECGFSAARMEDIASRAGFSKGTLYLYFNSKEDLFHGIVESIALPRLGELQNISKSSGSLALLLDSISEFAVKLIEGSHMPKLMKIMIGEAVAFPELLAAYRKNVIDQVLAAFESAITQANKRGECDVDDPALLARLIVSPIAFSAIWHTTFGRDPKAAVDLTALFNLHTQLLTAALIQEK